MESSVTESKVDRGYLRRRLSAVPSKEVISTPRTQHL